MILSYKFFRKYGDLLTLMELYCYNYGIRLNKKELYNHKLEWLGKSIEICKEKIKKMIADKWYLQKKDKKMLKQISLRIDEMELRKAILRAAKNGVVVTNVNKFICDAVYSYNPKK